MDQPLIPPSQTLPEITGKVIILSIILTILLAASNTYLALKIGILTSASIPAAILSMGILRFFKGSNVLENNLVQTAASAGEAVAGGIVYTVPALIIIHYWGGFAYWENVAIALAGGILGVLFSVPLRRVLMTAPHLHFPEGRAIAEVLHAGTQQSVGLKQILLGGSTGALLELAQNGLKIISSSMQAWFTAGNTLYGFGTGFSATLIGAGYLIGFNVALSLLIGAVIAWGISVPVLSTLTANPQMLQDAASTVANVYGEKIHYMGIGAMFTAGIWTLFTLLKPFYQSLILSVQAFTDKTSSLAISRTERDMPLNFIGVGILVMLVLLYFLFQDIFPLRELDVTGSLHLTIVLGAVVYILLLGFIFAAICGYFSGLVGVTASPGSAIIIGGILLTALLLRALLHFNSNLITSVELLNAAAITIIIGAVVAGAAAIANDNIQDLKVGHIIGATPWKQQIMLLLGVVIAALIIPPIMQLLFNVYGIGGVFPRAGMDPNQVLAAPPAAMIAAITQGVFNHDLPWNMLGAGAGVVIVFIIVNKFIQNREFKLSVLAIAIGMYLPLSSSVPLFIGGLIALICRRALAKQDEKRIYKKRNLQNNLMIACGLVSGAALMDVILAIPMGFTGNPDILNIMPQHWGILANILGIVMVISLGMWFYRSALNKKG